MTKPLLDEERQGQIYLIGERYNWENLALQTLDVYRKLISV